MTLDHGTMVATWRSSRKGFVFAAACSRLRCSTDRRDNSTAYCVGTEGADTDWGGSVGMSAWDEGGGPGRLATSRYASQPRMRRGMRCNGRFMLFPECGHHDLALGMGRGEIIERIGVQAGNGSRSMRILEIDAVPGDQ